jgi:MFS family permease
MNPDPVGSDDHPDNPPRQHPSGGFSGRDLPLLVAGSLVFYAAFGMSLPVLPIFVTTELDGGDVAVGTIVGAYALASVAARPLLGSFADQRGRLPLLVLGILITTIGTLGHVAARTLLSLVLLRLVIGVGVGSMMVAMTTMAVELAPVERRGGRKLHHDVAAARAGNRPVLR